MRRISHWTPRYVKNRLGVAVYNKTSPDAPWLTSAANTILNSYLKPSDIGLEFGSGRSTRWFASRVGQLISVEDKIDWAEQVREMLRHAELTNVDLRHIVVADASDTSRADYLGVTEDIADASLDFCLVDGKFRDHSAAGAVGKLKPGGLLVVDNVNLYLPSDSHSPNSRSHEDGPQGPVWRSVSDEIGTWRSIWTSNGVWDTGLYFKPCNGGAVP